MFAASKYTIVGWNDLGMHCMDSDFSVFSLLPPYNNFHAQVVDPNGQLIKSGSGITITYEAVADASGSINSTSAGKTNFWSNVSGLFGVSPPVDTGLLGFRMPATGPQTMPFDTQWNWWSGLALPITPYDNSGKKNPYPMMQLVARDATGTMLASTRIVLPVSDEMDCRSCHGSGTSAAAKPSPDWVNITNNPDRDYRLNILLLHDNRNQGSAAYSVALAGAGYRAAGLYATAIAGTSILCARCHLSNALPAPKVAGVSQLTTAIHSRHAGVTDPLTNLTLNNTNNRSACYRCHPGSATKCLRGAMGSAVAFDGSMEMQCQSCHGSMSDVGGNRQGWFDEPSCQNCHTGTAIRNSGQIRFTNVFSSPGVRRTASDLTFATNPNTPAANISLYRFSSGHGGLQCEACHGSTHAEYPSSHPNDNVQSISLEGHVGTIAECSTCHSTVPTTANGGPHGMHPVGQSWVISHHDFVEHTGIAVCQGCHGGDLRGTVLSRSFAVRTIQAGDFPTKNLWRGFQVGCYACHNGPSSSEPNPNRPPVVQNLALTVTGSTGSLGLKASDPDGNLLTLRVVSQPAHGRVGLSGTTATYFRDAGYVGPDSFTYAAWDGSIDSNLGTVAVTAR